MDVNGKSSVVFGGAQGIGKAYCEALLNHGAKVLFADIDKEAGEETERALQQTYGADKVSFMSCDIRDEERIHKVFQAAADKYGVVEIAVNNVGIVHEFDWKLCLDVNLSGNIRCVLAALKYMGKNNGGRGGAYVATSSISGLRPEYFSPIYAATKSGIINYVRSWALEENFAEHGIKMNCICPTRIMTNFIHESITPDRMMHTNKHLDTEQTGNEMSPSRCGDALLKLLTEGLNGVCLRVQRAGLQIAQFEEQPVQ